MPPSSVGTPSVGRDCIAPNINSRSEGVPGRSVMPGVGVTGWRSDAGVSDASNGDIDSIGACANGASLETGRNCESDEDTASGDVSVEMVLSGAGDGGNSSGV